MHALLAPLSLLIVGAALVAQDTPPPAQEPAPKAEQPAEKPAPKTLELGQRVNGGLTLLDIDGKEQKAMDLMGKVTVVNFYSIQCPVQAQWDERLAQIQKDFAEQGVVFLHIDSNVTEIGEKAPEQPKA
ncbi:MAG: AhpC/TSA family, partial [Planctomycetota bacterium]